jgi:hypothetical protein
MTKRQLRSWNAYINDNVNKAIESIFSANNILIMAISVGDHKFGFVMRKRRNQSTQLQFCHLKGSYYKKPYKGPYQNTSTTLQNMEREHINTSNSKA